MRSREVRQAAAREERLRGNRAETDDKFDAFGHRHVQLLHVSFRDENQKPAGWVGCRWNEHADGSFWALMKGLVLLAAR